MAETPENNLAGSNYAAQVDPKTAYLLGRMDSGGSKAETPAPEFIVVSEEETAQYAAARTPKEITDKLEASDNPAKTLEELALTPEEQKLVGNSLNLSSLYEMIEELTAFGFPQEPRNMDKHTPGVKSVLKLLKKEVKARKDYGSIFQTGAVYGEAARLQDKVGEWGQARITPNQDPATGEQDGYTIAIARTIGINHTTGATQEIDVPEELAPPELIEELQPLIEQYITAYETQMATQGSTPSIHSQTIVEKEPVEPMKDGGKGRGAGGLATLVGGTNDKGPG